MPVAKETPIILPVVLCQEGCRKPMRPKIVWSTSGKVQQITYHCDTHKVGWDPQRLFATGVSAPYDAAGAPADAPAAEVHKPAPQHVKAPNPHPGAVQTEPEVNPALVEALKQHREQSGT